MKEALSILSVPVNQPGVSQVEIVPVAHEWAYLCYPDIVSKIHILLMHSKNSVLHFFSPFLSVSQSYSTLSIWIWSKRSHFSRILQYLGKPGANSHALNFLHRRNHRFKIFILSLSCAAFGDNDMSKAYLVLILYSMHLIQMFFLQQCTKNFMVYTWLSRKVILSIGDCLNQSFWGIMVCDWEGLNAHGQI